MKPYIQRNAGAQVARRVVCGLIVLSATLVGCRGEGSPGRDTDAGPPETELRREGPYGVRDGVLYRLEGEATPLLALPGAGPAADTLRVPVAARPLLGKLRFEDLILSPDSLLLAWQTSGPGVSVGVAGSGEPTVRQLKYWSAAVPENLSWAPAGRYLAVRLRHPDGRSAVQVFDATTGEQLEMPWDAECAGNESCDVTRMEWAGGTLLDVEIRLGPAEPAVPFEVNVGGLAGL